MSGSDYLLWSYGQLEKKTMKFPPDPLPTTPSSPHSGKPRRGAVLMYPNVPYFVASGETHIWIHNTHALWCGNEGQTKLMCCCRCTALLTLLSLNMEKEEHSQNLLDDLTSLKARSLERREDIKQLDCSKHNDEMRD